MEIGPVDNNKPIQPSTSHASRRGIETLGSVTPPSAGPDRVEISEDARRRLAELADRALVEAAETGATPAEAEETEELSAAPEERTLNERLDEIRRRVECGYYERPEIKGDIADRLFGEIEP